MDLILHISAAAIIASAFLAYFHRQRRIKIIETAFKEHFKHLSDEYYNSLDRDCYDRFLQDHFSNNAALKQRLSDCNSAFEWFAEHYITLDNTFDDNDMAVILLLILEHKTISEEIKIRSERKARGNERAIKLGYIYGTSEVIKNILRLKNNERCRKQ